jgi:formylglycine-generating enzyme required for sulfatase activity
MKNGIVKIFVSYSHKSKEWVDEGSKYDLVPWLRDNLSCQKVEFWTDHTLKKEHIGEEYGRRIKENIDNADIAMLLITQDFCTSTFIIEDELPWIMERYDAGKIKIFPLMVDLVGRVGRDNMPRLFELEILPSDATTLLRLFEKGAVEKSDVRTEILDRLWDMIKKVRGAPSLATPPPPLATPVFADEVRSVDTPPIELSSDGIGPLAAPKGVTEVNVSQLLATLPETLIADPMGAIVPPIVPPPVRVFPPQPSPPAPLMDVYYSWAPMPLIEGPALLPVRASTPSLRSPSKKSDKKDGESLPFLLSKRNSDEVLDTKIDLPLSEYNSHSDTKMLGAVPVCRPRLSPKPVIGQAQTPMLRGNVPLEMLPVSPGTFWMGSPAGEPERSEDETRHSVRITRPYWLGKYVITQAQWEAIMEDNPSGFKGARRPVENVSWEDAMVFCRKLTEYERTAGCLPEGYRYTLPTEAEWEYACRAGTTSPFNTGHNLTTDWANYDGNHTLSGTAKGGCRFSTTDVGSFHSNAWGFYDMHGNVQEWCGDWYDGYPSGSVRDPVGAAFGSHRVFRGGGWFDGERICRSACRGRLGAGERNDGLGFRLALSAVGAE